MKSKIITHVYSMFLVYEGMLVKALVRYKHMFFCHFYKFMISYIFLVKGTLILTFLVGSKSCKEFKTMFTCVVIVGWKIMLGPKNSYFLVVVKFMMFFGLVTSNCGPSLSTSPIFHSWNRSARTFFCRTRYRSHSLCKVLFRFFAGRKV